MIAAAEQPVGSHGWAARLRLGFRASAERTVLATRERSGPLAVQRPFYPEGGVCHVYLLHPPGGVVGGDSLDVDVRLDSRAHALITAPGATKFYRSAGVPARVRQRLVVEPGATLEWLPHENIFFPGAAVDMQTVVELRGDARFAFWEIHCLGRPVIAEHFDHGCLDSRLSILRDGQPLLAERLRVDAARLTRRSQMAGFPVTGTLLMGSADADAVDGCRELLSDHALPYAAVTLLDGMLVLRVLGESTESARRVFARVWHRLRPSLIGREASAPRIWAT